MQELYKEILEKILTKHKDAVGVLVHGSSISGKLENYSDIDINVYILGKPENPIENEIIRFNNKKILINLNIENYKSVLNSIKNEQNAEQILLNLTAFDKIKSLYDKINLISRVKKEAKKKTKELRKKQIKLLTIKFNILIDFFFKLQRAHAKRDNIKMVYSAKIIASQSIRIIQFFNKLKPKEMYNSILSNYESALKQKNCPTHFKEDFMICMGLKERVSFKRIYNSADRMVKEAIVFLEKQNLKEIKNKEFFELLNQSKNL